MSDQLVKYLRAQAEQFSQYAAEISKGEFQDAQLSELAPPLIEMVAKLFGKTSEEFSEWADNLDPVTAAKKVAEIEAKFATIMGERDKSYPPESVEAENSGEEIPMVKSQATYVSINPAYMRLHPEKFS